MPATPPPTGLPQSNSPAAFSLAALVAQLLDLFPVEGRPPRIFSRQLSSAFAQTVECSLHLILIGVSSAGDEPGHRLAVARNHDLLAPLDPVKQSPKRILGLEGANLPRHRDEALFHLL